MIKIEYLLYESGKPKATQRLGLVTKEGIAESLLPWFKLGQHRVYINKHFSGHEGLLVWEIIDIHTSPGHIRVTLRSETSVPLSFGTFFGSQNIKNPSRVLRDFSVVDVDFGHKSFLTNATIPLKENERYVNSILPGELHKKRPCLVLSTSLRWQTAQVIPLTTRPPDHGVKAVEIPASSFGKASQRYREKPSYALIEMITSVSWLRMYPIRNQEGKFKHNNPLLLPSDSKKALCGALATSIYPEFTKDLEQAHKTLESVKVQLTALREANARIKLSEASMDSFIRQLAKELFEVEPEGVDAEQLMTQLAGEVDITRDDA